MSYQNCSTAGQSFQFIRQTFLQADGLPFAEVLNEEEVNEVMTGEGVTFGQKKNAVYTPALVLWGLLWQALASGAERSYEAAVNRLCILCVSLSLQVPSADRGAYWRACAKIPPRAVQRLALQVADQLEANMPEAHLWCKRHVKIVDGTTFMAPDTAANQAAWPQPASQQPGLGFPMLRVCAVVSLATGALCGFADGPYQGKETGETALLRGMLDRFQRGDVVLADRYYTSYFMIALLLARGVDVVFRQHQRRVTNYRQGKRLGTKDHVVSWSKPACPKWMDQATYDALPDTLSIRELDISVTIPGFRAHRVTVVTTLTNAKKYTKTAVAQLFRGRWHVELDLRAIKIQMGMEDIRGASPEAVRRELWAQCLAYNLIRKTMAQTAVRQHRPVRSFSFCVAMQSVKNAMSDAVNADRERLLELARITFRAIAHSKAGHRPNRVEPRAVKRRPKKQKLLTKPRAEARAELLATSTSAA